MKTIKKLITTGSILFLLLIVGSCSNNFDDLNDNPDATTEGNAAMLCTNVVLRVTKFGGKDAKAMISDNALPKYVGYANEGQLSSQYNLIGGSSFGDMTILPNIDKMVEYATGSTMENSYKGVGKFATALMFYKLTMEMGDIPFSEANLGQDGVYKPKYDSQEAVLIGVLNNLKEADQFFANGITFTGDPTPYNGNPAKWRKATNAFALKVLMSLSKKETVASLDIKNRFATIVAGGNLMDATTGFYGLSYSSTNKHPLSGTSDLFTSKTILSSLLVDNLKNLNNDRRLFYYAQPAAAQITAGKTVSDPAAYVGVDVAMNYSQMNLGHSAGAYSLINKRYLMQDATEPLRMMTYAEQELILAEAIIKGWITGSAQTRYENGVKAALTDVMAVTSSYAGQVINSAYINAYFVGEAAFKTTPADQLKQIWMQRYILNFMQEAETSFFEYRRNTYPIFPINAATSLNAGNLSGIPMRWTYPSSENSVNRNNLIKALDSQYEGYDEINKIMWVLK
ncbi:MAG: SusD/RagB family nutrient-binding outer membrane lipoprotein [Flavobacteriaceae bacterium]|nr:SusD/RagB family nutrient-binding outer membrane lipoprotein [Flavobacteriaceae bacterium]